MVIGRIARACAPSAGLALVLLAACGGKSVAVAGRDPGDGGTSGTSSSSGGGANRSTSGGASSGGASPGTAPNGGTGGTTAGTGGPPSRQMLDDGCETVCNKGSDAACEGAELNDCVSNCSEYVDLAMKTASCSTSLYEYIACILVLPDICDYGCEREAEDSVQCVSAYCRSQPNDAACTFLLGRYP